MAGGRLAAGQERPEQGDQADGNGNHDQAADPVHPSTLGTHRVHDVTHASSDPSPPWLVGARPRYDPAARRTVRHAGDCRAAAPGTMLGCPERTTPARSAHRRSRVRAARPPFTARSLGGTRTTPGRSPGVTL